MSNVRFAVIVLVFFAAVGSVGADELVYFANGTTMPIITHRFEGDMVHVRLTGNSEMAFPASMIDKIEQAGVDVFRNPEYYPANLAVPGDRGISAPQGGGGSYERMNGKALVPAKYRGASSNSPNAPRYMTPQGQAAAAYGSAGDDDGDRGTNSGPKGNPLGTKFRPQFDRAATPPGVRPIGSRYSIPSDRTDRRVHGITSLQPKKQPEPPPDPAATDATVPQDPAAVTEATPDPPADN